MSFGPSNLPRRSCDPKDQTRRKEEEAEGRREVER